jgi:hypothetical protein
MLQGKRKMIVIAGLAVGIVGAAAVLTAYGKITGAEFIDLTKWIGTSSPLAFAIGNGLEHIANGKHKAP